VKPTTDSSEGLSNKIAGDMASRAQVGAIILFGAPGVGKGTQARALSKLWAIPHISTGELLRTNVAKGTVLGSAVKEIVNRGDLVPNSLVKEMVELRLLEADIARGYILDGFPRTLEQAMWLTESVATFWKETPVLVVSIEVSRSHLLHRITGRRHCLLCQATFNIHENPPMNEGFCDYDNAELIQRSDDTEDILNRRLDLYDRLTSPVIEHFRTLGQFVEVSGDGPIEWITQRILGAYYLAASEANGYEPRRITNED